METNGERPGPIRTVLKSQSFFVDVERRWRMTDMVEKTKASLKMTIAMNYEAFLRRSTMF